MGNPYISTDMETQKSQEYWSKEEDFVKEPEIQKWRDLPKAIYLIREYETVKSRYGEACILKLETKEGEEAAVWPPQRMTKKLVEKRYSLVLNEGMGQSSETGNQFFKFTLMWAATVGYSWIFFLIIVYSPI